MRNILYISYDGLTDSLGQSQVLSYLRRLSKHGTNIVVVSYEKRSNFEKDYKTVKDIVDESGLTWEPLVYTKNPPVISTVYDLFLGLRKCRKLEKKYNFNIVHCRGYIAAILGLKLKRQFGLKFIFDMRGWWADEKKESGLWEKRLYKPVYKYFKKLEQSFFAESDYIVSLTYKGKEEISKLNLATPEKIGVIPTCVDFDVFKEYDINMKIKIRNKLGIDNDEIVFVYSGSLGGNYDPQILADVFICFNKVFPKSFLLVLSKEAVDTDMAAIFEKKGITRVIFLTSSFFNVTNYLRASDVGFIYYTISFSTIGRSPTKLGEYWASGLPVIAFKGIGDLDQVLAGYKNSGILLTPNKEEWAESISKLKFIAHQKLRNYSFDYFHINKGVSFYDEIYSLLSGESKAK